MTYFEVLGAELEAAAVRLARKRRRRRLAATAAAAVLMVGALGAGAVFFTGEDDAAVASVSVEQQGDRVSVVLSERHVPGDDVLAQLADAGVRAQANTVRTGVSLDGMTLGMWTDTGAAMVPDGDGYRLEVDADATIVVLVGTYDGTGPYGVPTDAFAPGEPLACIGWPGQAATDLERRAAEAGVAIRFLGTGDEPVTDVDGMVVERAEAHGPADVIAFVAPGAPVDGGCER